MAETMVAYGQVDNKGRIVPSKAIREALGLGTGSAVAFVKIGDALMVIPQDKRLENLMDRAVQVMEEAHISVEDLLADLPIARAEVVIEHYGSDFLEILEHAGSERTTTEGQ